MSATYRVTASVTGPSKSKWTGRKYLPVFEFDANRLGIVSCSHAEKIAKKMLEELGHPDSNVSAIRIERP